MKLLSCRTWVRFFLGSVIGGFVAITTLAAAEPTKECPQCHGSGIAPCTAGCDHGVRSCPGHCLKLSVGVWEHLTVAGHPPTDLWQKFPIRAGGYQAWNQNHVGQVVEMRDGMPFLVGTCPICHGTTKVTCTVCNGKGEIECPLCQGTGQVSASVQRPIAPDEFPLKDGRVLKGRIIALHGDMVKIRTNEGKVITVHRSDLVDPDANNQFR